MVNTGLTIRSIIQHCPIPYVRTSSPGIISDSQQKSWSLSVWSLSCSSKRPSLEWIPSSLQTEGPSTAHAQASSTISCEASDWMSCVLTYLRE
ncbi:hypothetical protein C0J52_27911 [Blattella germanica]|nr:hypothetical protein C0J52_27911 [Blattella germanica]